MQHHHAPHSDSPAGAHARAGASPWRMLPNVPVLRASEILGCSRGQVYVLARDGRLSMVKLAGRTLVTVASLIAFLETAQPFVPTGRDPRGRTLTAVRRASAA